MEGDAGDYAYPVFGDMAVSLIDVRMVTKVLDPIWSTKLETARRVRGRIESTLDCATVRGHRSGDNPARWRGHLQKAFPTRGATQRVRHHAALPFDKIAEFMSELRASSGVAARALGFAILTAARTGEIIGARWSEIDLEAGVWTAPEQRMKASSLRSDGLQIRVGAVRGAPILDILLESCCGKINDASPQDPTGAAFGLQFDLCVRLGADAGAAKPGHIERSPGLRAEGAPAP